MGKVKKRKSKLEEKNTLRHEDKQEKKQTQQPKLNKRDHPKHPVKTTTSISKLLLVLSVIAALIGVAVFFLVSPGKPLTHTPHLKVLRNEEIESERDVKKEIYTQNDLEATVTQEDAPYQKEKASELEDNKDFTTHSLTLSQQVKEKKEELFFEKEKQETDLRKEYIKKANQNLHSKKQSSKNFPGSNLSEEEAVENLNVDETIDKDKEVKQQIEKQQGFESATDDFTDILPVNSNIPIANESSKKVIKKEVTYIDDLPHGNDEINLQETIKMDSSVSKSPLDHKIWPDFEEIDDMQINNEKKLHAKPVDKFKKVEDISKVDTTQDFVEQLDKQRFLDLHNEDERFSSNVKTGTKFYEESLESDRKEKTKEEPEIRDSSKKILIDLPNDTSDEKNKNNNIIIEKEDNINLFTTETVNDIQGFSVNVNHKDEFTQKTGKIQFIEVKKEPKTTESAISSIEDENIHLFDVNESEDSVEKVEKVVENNKFDKHNKKTLNLYESEPVKATFNQQLQEKHNDPGLQEIDCLNEINLGSSSTENNDKITAHNEKLNVEKTPHDEESRFTTETYKKENIDSKKDFHSMDISSAEGLLKENKKEESEEAKEEVEEKEVQSIEKEKDDEHHMNNYEGKITDQTKLTEAVPNTQEQETSRKSQDHPDKDDNITSEANDTFTPTENLTSELNENSAEEELDEKSDLYNTLEIIDEDDNLELDEGNDDEEEEFDDEDRAYHVPEKRTKIIPDYKYIKISDGVKKYVLQDGYGDLPKKGDKITLHCVGYIDKKPPKMFWNTKELGQRMFSFAIGERQVIKGWDEAAASMKQREKSKFKIEAKKAYGKFGFKAWDIPPHSDLIMEFETMSIKRSKKRPLRSDKY